LEGSASEPGNDQSIEIGYFQLLMEQKQPLAILTVRGLELNGFVRALAPGEAPIIVQIPQVPPEALFVRDPVRLVFGAHENRWEGISKVLRRMPDDQFAFALPPRLDRSNRRAAVRVRVDPSHAVNVQVKVRREGPTLAGTLIEISRTGFSMNLDGDGSPGPGSAVPGKGQECHSMVIAGLAEDTIEAGAILRDVTGHPHGTRLHFQFRGLLHGDREFLDAWTRTHQALELESLPPLPGARPGPAAPLRLDALKRVRKKLRKLMLVIEPGPVRDGLLALLARDGYVQVSCVEAIEDLVKAFDGGNVHLVFVRDGVGGYDTEDTIRILGRARGDLRCPIVQLVKLDNPLARKLAAKAGADQICPFPEDAETLPGKLEQWLGLD